MPEFRYARSASTRKAGLGKAAALLLLLLLLALAWVAARWGLADVAAMRPRAQMARWDKAYDPPAAAVWQAARSDMQTALEFEPGNPNLLADMARMSDWGAMRDDLSAEEAAALRRQSLDYFKQALQQRPVSPFAWSSLALQKFKLREVDAEFFAALAQAMALGPWEPGVQLLAAELGLATWQQLSPELRAAATANLQRGLQRQSAAIWRIAQQNQQTKLVCELGREQPARLPKGACA